MKQVKKIFCIACAIIMIVSLAGCSSKDKEKEADDGVFSFSDGLDKNGFFEGIKAKDHVDMIDYKGISVPAETHTVTEEDVQIEIDAILAEYPDIEEIKDRAIADGDTVNIDYVGSVDGVEFEGGSTSGEGYEVIIGETSFVDDFIDQLIGHKPGDKFDVNVTFPEDYQEPSLQGKDAVFKTTINFIIVKTNPELTDAFVADKLQPEFEWTTVKEMKDGIEEDIQGTRIETFIGDYLVANFKVNDLPRSIVEYQENAMIDYYTKMAESYGMTLEDLLPSMANVETVEALLDAELENNENTARYYLVVQAIAEDAKIKATEDDVAEFFKTHMGVDDFSEYETEYGMPYLKQNVINQKVIELIKENVKLL